jgi:hypothetical protein
MVRLWKNVHRFARLYQRRTRLSMPISVLFAPPWKQGVKDASRFLPSELSRAVASALQHPKVGTPRADGFAVLVGHNS